MHLPKPLVSVDWLALHHQHVILVDCRYGSSDDPDAGRRAYEAAHLPGAVYFHLDTDMSGPVQEHGGGHPLPDLQEVAAKLGALGIGPGTPVVAYDATGPYAARFWWLLRYLGHDEVAVLDGGYDAWVARGLPRTADRTAPAARTFVTDPRPEMVATMTDVRDRGQGQAVIDARSPERFGGQASPLDPKSGHIPGAVNRFWQESVRPDGTWKGPAEQAARFAGLPAGPDAIHSCGSGVTACANLLAMEIAGLKGARLYVGSWSDWCTYPGNEVEK